MVVTTWIVGICIAWNLLIEGMPYFTYPDFSYLHFCFVANLLTNCTPILRISENVSDMHCF